MEKNKEIAVPKKHGTSFLSEKALSVFLLNLPSIDKTLADTQVLDKSNKAVDLEPMRFLNWKINQSLFLVQQLYKVVGRFKDREEKPGGKGKSYFKGLFQLDFDGKLTQIQATLTENGATGMVRLRNATRQLKEFLELVEESRRNFNALHIYCDRQASDVEINSLKELLGVATKSLISATRALCMVEVFPDRSYTDICTLSKERSFEEMANPEGRYSRRTIN